MQQMEMAVPESARLLLLQARRGAPLTGRLHLQPLAPPRTPCLCVITAIQRVHSRQASLSSGFPPDHPDRTRQQEDKFKVYFSQLSHVVHEYEGVLAKVGSRLSALCCLEVWNATRACFQRWAAVGGRFCKAY